MLGSLERDVIIDNNNSFIRSPNFIFGQLIS